MTTPEPGTVHASAGLRRNAVGLGGLVFFVLSAQAPLTGIAGAAPISIALGNGLGVPGSYVVAGVVVALFAVGFLAMSRHVVDAGAFYAYIREGLGGTAGHGSAALALLAYNAVQAAMYGLYGAVTAGLLDEHAGVSPPWWLCALVTMAVVQVLGVAGIDVGAKVLAVLVLAETSLLVLFDARVLGAGGGPEGLGFLEVFSPEALFSGAPGVALMFAVASMLGFEATAIYAEEAKEPERTVPRATYLAVIVITGFFAFTTWMLIAFYGASRAVGEASAALESGDGAAFVASAVARRIGAWSGTALSVLLATSLLAGILAFHNSINRYLFALGRDRTLPEGLAKVNHAGSPWVASITQTATALVLVLPFAVAGSDPVLTLFSWFAGVAVLAIMVLYLLTSLSVLRYFRTTPVDARRWNTVVAPALATLSVGLLVVVILANFTTLIDGSAREAATLIAIVPAFFALGAAVGQRQRREVGPDLQPQGA